MDPELARSLRLHECAQRRVRLRGRVVVTVTPEADHRGRQHTHDLAESVSAAEPVPLGQTPMDPRMRRYRSRPMMQPRKTLTNSSSPIPVISIPPTTSPSASVSPTT